jgi:hypothetical protein
MHAFVHTCTCSSIHHSPIHMHTHTHTHTCSSLKWLGWAVWYVYWVSSKTGSPRKQRTRYAGRSRSVCKCMLCMRTVTHCILCRSFYSNELYTYTTLHYAQVRRMSVETDPNAEVLHWLQVCHLIQTTYSQETNVYYRENPFS